MKSTHCPHDVICAYVLGSGQYSRAISHIIDIPIFATRMFSVNDASYTTLVSILAKLWYESIDHVFVDGRVGVDLDQCIR